MEVATIQPQELSNLKDWELIDVRTPAEYGEVHAKGAKNFPLDTLDPQALQKSRSAAADQPIYLICRSGGRGKKACEKLLSAGWSNVINVEGGTAAWEAAGLPVVRGKKAISLERQVRIAAGSLVLIGTLLALLHPGFLVIPAFIGSGLIFAGITDWCGMGMLIAKLPWNQAPKSFCAIKKPTS